MDVGLLVIRAAVAAALLVQGASKVRPGARAGTAAFFRSVGFEPAAALAVLTAAVEIAAGLLLAGGLATPLAAAGALSVLVNAAVVNGARGWASSNNGAEYPVTLALVVAGLAFAGPGGVSLDAVLGIDEVHPVAAASALAVAIGAAIPFLALRHRRLRQSPHRSDSAVTAPTATLRA